MTTPILRMIPQRHQADCGVAVLASYCGVSYEEALLAVGTIAPDVLEAGLWLTQVMRASRKLGRPLARRKRFDLENDEGILHVSSPNWARDHLVVLKAGLVFDTDGQCWEAEIYATNFNATFHVLLTAE